MQATIQAAAPAVQITARDLAAGAVQHPQQGGGFFQMMLQQLSQAAQGGDLSALSELLAANGQQQTDDEDGLLLAAQLMAQMLALPPGELSTIMEQASAPETAAAQATGVSVQPNNLLALLSQLKPEQQSPTEQTQPAAQAAKEAVPFEVVLNSQAAQPANQQQTAEPMSLQSRFQTAVAEAQRLIKEQPETATAKETAAPDIDALQKRVDAERGLMVSSSPTPATFSTGSVKAETAIPESPNLLEQVSTGITQKLAAGQSEFVIKLKPEGLGEITVKMLAEGGKTTLSIITSSTQVERLLNSELSNLRESLRPLGAEVKEVISQSADYNPPQHDGRFRDEQQRQPHHSNHYYSGEEEHFAADDSLLVHQQLLSSLQMLNRYI